jgi:TPR repeat protein
MYKLLLLGLLVLPAVSFAADTAEQIKQAATQGNALAEAKLAALYILGRDGVEKDEQQAALWMEKAAKQNLVEAEVVMAALYDRGMGVTADREKATAWYEKAAAQGHGTSLAILGRNPAAEGAVQFNYQSMRLSAAKSIPSEYAKKLLTIQLVR